jgi:hypothetical protein
MRKAITILAMAAAAFTSAVFSVTPAMAAGPTLTCTFSPGDGRFLPGLCENNVPRFSYTLTWLVQGVTGSASYSWTHPGNAFDGCTSTSDDCSITVSGHAANTFTAKVVVTQGSTHTTLSESAEVEPVCPGEPTPPVFC